MLNEHNSQGVQSSCTKYINFHCQHSWAALWHCEQEGLLLVSLVEANLVVIEGIIQQGQLCYIGQCWMCNFSL
jgi:hypothetical protein